MGISNIVLLLGGVALFLFGMALMGDGLKRVAGNKLELILYRLSGTPLKGMLLGTGVTAVIQSSSAVSVMTVGFVNSSMMKVRQAISVIMGAIVGTSITGWIISLSQIGRASGALSLLSTESISAIMAIIGMVMTMASKKNTVKRIGGILMGFSILMFGMKTMSQSVEVLKTNESFIATLTSFSNPFIGILVGFLFTAILQSSSATVGILQALSTTGAISFDIALPIVLGIALGAAVPVILSSIGSTVNGKRAAFSYPLIEICRVVIFSLVFYTLNALFKFDFMTKTLNMVDIAFLNSFFRFITVLVLSPFTDVLERILNAIVPDKAEKTDPSLKEIDNLETRFLAYPPLAVEQSRLAVNSMAKKTKLNVQQAFNLMFNYSEDKFNEAHEVENLVDKFEDKIGTYLMQLTGKEMSREQSASVSKYLHALTDFERISDHALNIAESAKEIAEKNIDFSEEAKREIIIMENAVTEVMETTVKSFIDDNVDWARRVEPLEQTIDLLCVEMKDHHIARLQKGMCTYQHSYVFNDLMTNFERISDHCSNIAVALIELKENTMASHEFEDRLKEDGTDYAALFKEFRGKYSI